MQKDKVLAIVEQGYKAVLQLRPVLVEWSKQDPDLNPLRERADYEALYSE